MIKIAVDGLTGSGKGTLSDGIAKRFNLKHLDTGAIFRGMGVSYLINKAGEPTEQNIEQELEKAHISVTFENDKQQIYLNGSNITSSDRIVLIAEIQNPGEPTEWTKFDIPFESRNGKKFDYNKLANNEYAIAVVASSSKDGAFFEGAVGSTLFVDEIKIEWENK